MDWQAKWIWPSVTAVPSHPNQFMRFRKSFLLTAAPANADIAVFADSRYQLYVNGHLVGRGPARGPVFWGYYDVFNVAKYLKPGKNVIAAEVRWLDAPMGWFREPPGAANHGGLLCQLAIGTGADRKIIATDVSWKAQEDASMRWGQPLMNGALPEIEVTDGSLADSGWNTPDFDDSKWLPVQITTGQSGQDELPLDPFAHLEQRPMRYPIELKIAPAKIVDAGWTTPGPSHSAPEDNANGKQIPPAAVADLAGLGHFISIEPHHSDLSILANREALTRTGPDKMATLAPAAHPGATSYVIFDMGKEVDGYPHIAVDAPAGTLIELAWSEVLTSEGNVDATEPGGNYVARYFTRKGLQTWPLWGWHGMRYLEVRVIGNTAPVRFHTGLIFSTANLQRAGSFESSDPLLNKLWQMGAYTFQLCTFDGTMDCPTREQREWVGDGEVELQVNDVVNNDPDVDRKFLLDAARDQRQDGAIPSVAASGQSEDWVIDDYIFSFVDAAHWYYIQTGDNDLMNEIYPNIVRSMMWFQAFRQKDGMLGKLPYWTFLGWSNPDKNGESSIMNALYVHALENAADIADVEKDASHAQLFRDEARQIRQGFNAKFWNASRGLYVDSWKDGKQNLPISQIANADAVLYGFAPKQNIPTILTAITTEKNLKQQRHDPVTGASLENNFDPRLYIKQAETYGSNYLLDALMDKGFETAALNTMRKNWGPMAATGNGTFWEQFTQNGGTSCHAWSASPTYVLSRSVLGVMPTSARYASYTVAPQLGDLAWAKGTIPTPNGNITVSWRLSPGQSGKSRHFDLDFNTPFAANVHFVMPSLAGKQATSIRLNGHSQDENIHLSAAGDYKLSADFE
jgi:alpha-L-rhamnosidase